jgi:hypothetical protein
MKTKIGGLLGALAGLATMGSAQAAIHPAPNATEALQASSYAELLAPVPNAAALLKADDATRAQRSVAGSLNGVQLAQEHHHHHQQQYQQPQQYRQQSQHHHHHQQQYRQQSQHHHHHQQQY